MVQPVQDGLGSLTLDPVASAITSNCATTLENMLLQPEANLTELEYTACLYALRRHPSIVSKKQTVASCLVTLLSRLVELENYRAHEWNHFLQLLGQKPTVFAVSDFLRSKPSSCIQEVDDNFLYNVCAGLKSALALSEIVDLLPHVLASLKEQLIENSDFDANYADYAMAKVLLALYICLNIQVKKCDIEQLTQHPDIQAQVFELLSTATAPTRREVLFSAFCEHSVKNNWHKSLTLKELEALLPLLERISICRIECVQGLASKLCELKLDTNACVQSVFYRLEKIKWTFAPLDLEMDSIAYFQQLLNFLVLDFGDLLKAIYQNGESLEKMDIVLQECMMKISDNLKIFADTPLPKKIDAIAAQKVRRSVLEFLSNCYKLMQGQKYRQEIFTHIKNTLGGQEINGHLSFPIGTDDYFIFKNPDLPN